MSIDLTGRPADARRSRRPIPWLTVGLLAAAMAYADGFLVQTLRGSVGSIQRNQTPFESWARESTLALPVFVLAVLGVLAIAHRRFGPELRRPKPVLATALLIAVAGTVLGVAAASASAAYDYHLQSTQLKVAGAAHSTGLTGEDHHAGGGVSPDAGADTSCTGICLMQRQTLAMHVKGLKYIGGGMLASNLVLVGWVVALRGGQLDAGENKRRRTVAATPTRELTPELV
jgi:hypothetical protein